MFHQINAMDATSFKRYIRENNTSLFIDLNRIIASGGSAGGHLAASTATLPLFDDHKDNLKSVQFLML